MKRLLTFAMAAALLGGSITLMAHCQVPCGIYHDKTETIRIYEDLGTIEKCMNEINRISAEKKPDYNQLVRWINTKENHADKIQKAVWQYFMLQRVAPAAPDSKEYPAYVRKLTLLHALLVDAMKCKQGTDLSVPRRMKETLKAFEKAYPPAAVDSSHTH